MQRAGHHWPDTLHDAFDILDAYPIGKHELEEIRQAAAALTIVYRRAAKLLEHLPEEIVARLGFPLYLRSSIRGEMAGFEDCVIGRFDLARTDSGYKMLEFNSDAPGLILEAFAVNGAVCRDGGYSDPNSGCEAMLREALSRAVQACLKNRRKVDGHPGNVAVAGGRDFRRARAETKYLCEMLRPFSAQNIAVEDLGIDPQGLYGPQRQPIDVLLMGCSLKWMRSKLGMQEGQTPGHSAGGSLPRLVEDGALALINPPSAVLLENKAIQAIIWNLAESGIYFGDEEIRSIHKYMLPTYWDPPGGKSGYVAKPVQGAEGDTVTVVNAGRKKVVKDERCSYSDQPFVYQEYVDLPRERLMTEYGPRTLHLVMSCFVVDGAPSAICMRAGAAITNEMAWVVPMCVDDRW